MILRLISHLQRQNSPGSLLGAKPLQQDGTGQGAGAWHSHPHRRAWSCGASGRLRVSQDPRTLASPLTPASLPTAASHSHQHPCSYQHLCPYQHPWSHLCLGLRGRKIVPTAALWLPEAQLEIRSLENGDSFCGCPNFLSLPTHRDCSKPPRCAGASLSFPSCRHPMEGQGGPSVFLWLWLCSLCCLLLPGSGRTGSWALLHPQKSSPHADHWSHGCMPS